MDAAEKERKEKADKMLLQKKNEQERMGASRTSTKEDEKMKQRKEQL